MQNSTWIWVVVIVVILGGAFFLWQGTLQPASPAPSPAPVTPPSPSPSPSAEVPMSARVTFDGSKFTPQEVTIKKGGTVTWVSSSKDMWVASAVHPSHEVYSGTSRQQHCPDTSGTAFDQCKGGSGYSFTFEKVGTWSYHDHLTPTAFGKVVVVE